LTGWLEYDTDLFHASTIARQIGHYRNLLEAVVRDSDLRLRELPMLSAAELHQVVAGWNDTDAGYARALTLHGLFESQAARTPEAPAAEHDTDRLTYAELNRRANRLAHHLIGLGVGDGCPVGLHLGRGLHDLVALLGILKAGGAYVPIDVGQPVARIEAIVRAAEITCLVTAVIVLPAVLLLVRPQSSPRLPAFEWDKPTGVTAADVIPKPAPSPEAGP